MTTPREANNDSSSSYHQRLQEIGKQLVRDKYIFLSAETLRSLLLLGMDDDDDASRSNSNTSFTSYWDETAPQQDEQGTPVYAGKHSLCSYYHSQSNQRTSGYEATTLEHIDPTTVHHVSNLRLHKSWPAAADKDATLMALRQFIFKVLEQVLQSGKTSSSSQEGAVAASPSTSPSVFETMQTAYRVIKNAQVAGDPGPEGVHQDAATLTAIVLIQRQNVQGGLNRVWTLEQPNGMPSAEDLENSKGRLIHQVVLENCLDTLLVLDRQVKHQATAIYPHDPNVPAVRDVLTFEVRPKTS